MKLCEWCGKVVHWYSWIFHRHCGAAFENGSVEGAEQARDDYVSYKEYAREARD